MMIWILTVPSSNETGIIEQATEQVNIAVCAPSTQAIKVVCQRSYYTAGKGLIIIIIIIIIEALQQPRNRYKGSKK